MTVSEGPVRKRHVKKAKRMGDAGQMVPVRMSLPGKTARERAINLEKEKSKKRAEKVEKQRERERLLDEREATAKNAEDERAESAKILEWIEKIKECPVFTPTKEEFADPLKYIESLAAKVAPTSGICKVIPPYVPLAFSGRNKFRDPDFLMEVRKQPLRMVAWKDKENEPKGVSFNKDTRRWTVRQLEEFANEFVQKNYDGSASQLQLRFIELEFWKEFLLRQNKHVRYASDVPGTAFDDFEELAKSDWNLGKLPMLPDSVLRIVESGIPGVTEPMLYVGMLFSMFAWHTEDQYLYSINYHHLGAPKTWYGVPGSAAQAFERVAAEKVFSLGLDPHDLAHTLRLLIGKTIMFPPGLLVDAGVPVYRAVQMPGEYVVTFPRSYHAGFSNGFNTGEAVNFAMPDWFAYGAACTRRYRLLRQIQVVAYDELLCKEAQHLHKRMVAQGTKGGLSELSSMDKSTMVEFVRLLRWQHYQRWKLHQLGAQPRAIASWRSKSSECGLCNHKSYLAYVLCDCQDVPICLNHPSELASCPCQPHLGPDGKPDLGRVVKYVQELPLLERLAAEFERYEGVEAAVVQAAEDEQSDKALRDEWELSGRSEMIIGDGGPTDAIDMRAYQRWAPIPGYDYDEVSTGKALPPATPSQQTRDGTPELPLLSPVPDSGDGCQAMQMDPPPLPFSPLHSHPSAQPQPATPPLVAPTTLIPAPTPGFALSEAPSVGGRAAHAPSTGRQRRREGLTQATRDAIGSGAEQEGRTGGRKRKAVGDNPSDESVEDGNATVAAQATSTEENKVKPGRRKKGNLTERPAGRESPSLLRSGKGRVAVASEAMEDERGGKQVVADCPLRPDDAAAMRSASLAGTGMDEAGCSGVDATANGGSWDEGLSAGGSPSSDAEERPDSVVGTDVAMVGVEAGSSGAAGSDSGDPATPVDDPRFNLSGCGMESSRGGVQTGSGPGSGMCLYGLRESALEAEAQAVGDEAGEGDGVGAGTLRSEPEEAMNEAQGEGRHAAAAQVIDKTGAPLGLCIFHRMISEFTPVAQRQAVRGV